METKVAKSRRIVLITVAMAAAVMLLAPPPVIMGAAAAAAAAETPPRGCTRRCGSIDIPYPFGIEPGCYHATGFNLTCDDRSYHHHQPPKLFLGDGTVQVLEISVPNATVRINSNRVKFDTSGDDDGHTVIKTWGSGLPRRGPYFLSDWYDYRNILHVENYNVQVDLIAGGQLDGVAVASCTSFFPIISADVSFVVDGNCAAGLGCCQANIYIGDSFYNIQIRNLNRSFSTSRDGLGSVYIGDHDFNYSMGMPPEAVPATLSWTISNSSCPANTSAPECRSAHSSCQNTSLLILTGYTCHCYDGYQGNPYIADGCHDIDECNTPDLCYGDCMNTPGSFICHCPSGYTGNAYILNGCKDIDECEHPEAHSCYGTCKNYPGGYQCQCPDGTYGNPFTKQGCITIKNSFTGLSIGLGVGGGMGLLLLALGGSFMMRKIKLRNLKRKNFKQNQGLLLQQLISRNANISERMVITLREIEKATNNFDRDRVVGGGGHGVVFKGNLGQHLVAIKKSKIIVQREIDEFINEVVILSQVNHRNVVKFLGCCLETEVPLLVYEFISNRTLYHHLHVEGSTSISWDDRLRIALEVARALSYLHSATSMPIFHRDVKSSNILLDDRLTAKVSDFGASRYIPIDQTGVTTAVQGTIGYLDPMYYVTGRLTDKSDVYSFGVLLVELLTRKKPFVHRPEYCGGLVSHFTSLLAEGNLVDIMDPQVIEEENGEVQEVAALAATCTEMQGEDRPTMRQVEMALENLLSKGKEVPCHTTLRRYDGNETTAHYMSIIKRDTEVSSRQYTMEEEILLSSRYPR